MKRLGIVPDIIRCPGCLNMIKPDELCCDSCWKRVPVWRRVKLNVVHKASNWPRYLDAEEAIRKWLEAHYEPHYDR